MTTPKDFEAEMARIAEAANASTTPHLAKHAALVAAGHTALASMYGRTHAELMAREQAALDRAEPAPEMPQDPIMRRLHELRSDPRTRIEADLFRQANWTHIRAIEEAEAKGAT